MKVTKVNIEAFSFFLLQKVILFPSGPRLERGLQDVKKATEWLQRGASCRSLDLGSAPQRPLGFRGSRLCWRVNLWKRFSPSLAWGPASLRRLVQVVAHLLDKFHLLIQDVSLQEVRG